MFKIHCIMITKIKVDGKEHMAIVFDSCTADVSEVFHCKLALADLMGQLLAYDEENMISHETFADVNTLLMQMQPDPQLMFEFYNTYWGKNDTPKTARVKPCEIYE